MTHYKPSVPVLVTVALGAALALLGVILFGSAHAITTPPPGVGYNDDQWRLDEVLWSTLGIALMMAGLLFAALGMNAWCRQCDNPGPGIE